MKGVDIHLQLLQQGIPHLGCLMSTGSISKHTLNPAFSAALSWCPYLHLAAHTRGPAFTLNSALGLHSDYHSTLLHHCSLPQGRLPPDSAHSNPFSKSSFVNHVSLLLKSLPNKLQIACYMSICPRPALCCSVSAASHLLQCLPSFCHLAFVYTLLLL